MMQPLLIAVTGLPCSGKSTLARRLGARLGFAVYEKDVVKEALFDALGTGDREWSRNLSTASFNVLLALAERAVAGQRSAIVEGNFRPEHAPSFERLRAQHGAQLVQVLCGGSGRVLVERFDNRARRQSRHVGHLDALALAELRTDLERGFAAPLAVLGLELRFESPRGAGPAQIDALLRAIDDVRRGAGLR